MPSLDAINSLQLRINQCGHVFLDDRWKLTDMAMPYSKLYYIRSGSGYILTEGQQIPLEPGYVYLTPAGTRVSCGCTALEKIYFHISVSSIDSGDLLEQVSGVCRLPFSEEAYSALLACCGTEDYSGLLRLKTILLQTTLAFLERYAPEDFSVRQYSETVRRALSYIHSNPRANLRAAEIAEALYVSESKLRKLFRTETGKNLGKYIDEAVFLRAAQLLLEERVTVQDVSARLGFCDQFYFAKRFKTRYFATPTEYRRHNFYIRDSKHA